MAALPIASFAPGQRQAGIIGEFAVPVARRNPEWGWLEYLLTVSCQTARLRLRAGWSVANSRLAQECEQRCRNLLQLYAWVPVSELPANTTVQDVCRNGFHIAGGGMSFHIGNIKLPSMFKQGGEAVATRGYGLRSRGRALPAGRRLYEFLLCRIGVGRSFLIEDPRQAETLEIPPEYDSFFVRHDPADEALGGEIPGILPRHILHHEYIVRDPTQALPLYLVHFEYDPDAEEKLALPVCDNCGANPALLYCEADDARLCESCDARVHSANSVAQRHIRVPINERPGAPVGNCPDHPDTEVDEFCKEDRYPICPHCRSLGSHSMGDAAKHHTLPIVDAYRTELKRNRVGNPPTLASRLEVDRRLSELDRKLAAVQQSGQVVEDQVYDQIQQAVQQGQDLAEEQVNYLLADELEAKRQLDTADWLESFLDEGLKSLPPPDFLATWLQLLRAREEMAGFGGLSRPHAVAGLRVEGALRVVAAPHRGEVTGGTGAKAAGKGRADGRRGGGLGSPGSPMMLPGLGI